MSSANSSTERPILQAKALTILPLSPGLLFDRWNNALPKLTKIAARITTTKNLNATAAYHSRGARSISCQGSMPCP